jgi:hypothetical protein
MLIFNNETTGHTNEMAYLREGIKIFCLISHSILQCVCSIQSKNQIKLFCVYTSSKPYYVYMLMSSDFKHY